MLDKWAENRQNIGKAFRLPAPEQEEDLMDVAIDVSSISISTDRLLLRPIALSDAPDMFAYASVPGVGEMAGWKHHQTIAETETILSSMLERKEVLALIYKADGKMIGTLGLHPAGKEEQTAYPQLRMREVGYVLSKAYWGQGLMAEAVKALIAYCFDTLKLDLLVCCHFSSNNQSAV